LKETQFYINAEGQTGEGAPRSRDGRQGQLELSQCPCLSEYNKFKCKLFKKSIKYLKDTPETMSIANMNYKIAVTILVLIFLSWPTASVEALYLGSGVGGQVINLDAGAKQSSEKYNFGRSGFVAPTMPQSMALSPNIMVTQAEGLVKEAQVARDGAVSARDEARANYNETQVLLSKIDDKESSIQHLLKSAEASAEASAMSAAQAAEFLNRTETAYGRTLGLSVAVEGNLSLMKSLLQEAKSYANASAINASQLATT